jgi:sterol desaturase/sphingolipid hydroxylase (fatty acid hydroxylase superfamily)
VRGLHRDLAAVESLGAATLAIHNLHHIDPALDVSTGFRFHSGELLISAVFRVVQTSAIGMLFATFAACEVVFQANTVFTIAICGCRFVSSDG